MTDLSRYHCPDCGAYRPVATLAQEHCRGLMPYKPKQRCTQCKRLHEGTGKCERCRKAAEAASDRARGTASSRGYTGAHISRFRAGVLDRDPICVICHEQLATVADHWPKSRRTLIAEGLDPNNPDHGRGLCTTCHNRETARNQPGGWNRKDRP